MAVCCKTPKGFYPEPPRPRALYASPNHFWLSTSLQHDKTHDATMTKCTNTAKALSPESVGEELEHASRGSMLRCLARQIVDFEGEQFSQNAPMWARQHAHHGGQLLSSSARKTTINLLHASLLMRSVNCHICAWSLDSSHTLAGCRQMTQMRTARHHFSLLHWSACHCASSGHVLQCHAVRFCREAPGPIGCWVAMFIAVFAAVMRTNWLGDARSARGLGGCARTSFWHKFKKPWSSWLYIYVSKIVSVLGTKDKHYRQTSRRIAKHRTTARQSAHPPAQGWL